MGSCSIFFITVVICLVVAGAIAMMVNSAEESKIAEMTEEERQRYLKAKRERVAEQTARAADTAQGPVRPSMICPHCQRKGRVRTKTVKQKKGISGGKAAAAVLTAGTSILATGLSRKESVTEAHCDYCRATWHF